MSNLLESLSQRSKPVEIEEFNIPKLNLFDIIDDISYKKKYIYDVDRHKMDEDYSKLRFHINKRFSHFHATVMDTNDINIRYGADSKMHFDYLFYSIKSKFRKGPWPKKINMEHIDMIKRKYGYSQKRAEEALELLNDEQLKKIKESLFLGGTSKNYDF